MTVQDVTPEGSVSPVYLDPTPQAPVDAGVDLDQIEADRTAARASGFAALMALGLTEEQAEAIAGNG